jgi:ankyrin repeat protein
MAQPTPQTLQVFEMLDEPDEQQAILQYITLNPLRIDVNYVHPVQGTMLFQSVIHEYAKVAKKLLDLGATLNEQTINAFISNFSFDLPLARAKELMTALLNAGFPKEKMLHVVCSIITGIHKELLKTLLEQPLDINYKYNGKTVLHLLIYEFSVTEEDYRGIFIEMLRMLIKKGANPNEVDAEGRTAIQLVNTYLADHNPGPIRQILQNPAVPAVPAVFPVFAAPAAAPAQDYKKLWTEELKKPSPDIAKLEQYKNAGAIDVNAMIDSRENPLSLRLSKNPDMKLLEALLKWGANPNLIIKNKVPLFWLVFERSIKDIKPILLLMIKYGADVKLIANNKTFLIEFIRFIFSNYAEFTEKSKEIADILINYGVDIHYKYNDRDILDEVLDYGNKNAVDYLINKGLSVIVNGRTRFYEVLRKMNNPYSGMNGMNALNILLSHHSDNNAYFKDYLDFALAYPSTNIIKDLYSKLKNRLILNYNEVYMDGSTPLIKAVQLYTKAPQPWVKTMIESMVEKGANVSYIDPTGKKAIDYTTDEELKELLGEKHFKILWTGFSRADIDFTNMIFEQTTHATNLAKLNPDESLFSICPVCLKYIQHETGTCMYMTHSCVEQAGYNGYYHKKLWDAFSYEKAYDALGRDILAAQRKRVLEWCTNCGRICKGHRHYELKSIYKSGSKDIVIPGLLGQGDYFATTCDKPGIGGGGIKEKLNRYRRFREVVLALNDPSIIGQMAYEDAINTLVEAVWEAPLDPRRFEIRMIETQKKYNKPVANNRFPLPSELPAPPKYVYSDPTYPDASNPDLLPLVYSKATNTIKNSAYDLFGDDDNIVQFRHRMANGNVNNHDGPNQQIALDRLIGAISLMNETPASVDFGMCWQHAKDAYDNIDMLDNKAHKPPKCTAKMYPDEVLHAIQSATYSDELTKEQHLGVYAYYKKLFGEKFGKPIGLAATNNSNKVNASNSKNNSNQDGGKRWSTRKRKHKGKTLRIHKRR